MTFYDEFAKWSSFDIDSFCATATDASVRAVLAKSRLQIQDFCTLLSDAADPFLEEIAFRSRETTRRHFGNIIYLFTPLYISNYCENVCAYCSFARQHDISRRHLDADEIRAEAVRISDAGIRHILVLTGESRTKANPAYLAEAVEILREHFSSISLEVYPLSEAEYGELIRRGVDGLTIYQETYDKTLYRKLHEGGPKQDFRFRLETPDRACRMGVRTVTVGALFGLHNWRSEAFFTALHAQYLQKRYPAVDIAVSFPRIRPLAGEFNLGNHVSDRQFVRMMTAMRCLLPSAGITVSTRESRTFRNSVLPLGVTRMSAGVSTAVGGHTGNPSTTQFEIADIRSVDEMKAELLQMGFQAVMHDWNSGYISLAV